MDQLLKEWNVATGNLPYGVQRVFLETLTEVKDEHVHLVWGADYRESKPCLVNAVANMLGATGGKGGHGIPTQKFPEVVRAFDAVNYELRNQGVNTNGYVSSLAAEILIRNFGTLKPEPDPEYLVSELSHGRYIEPTDEEMARDWFNAMKAPELDDIKKAADAGSDIARFAAEYIENH